MIEKIHKTTIIFIIDYVTNVRRQNNTRFWYFEHLCGYNQKCDRLCQMIVESPLTKSLYPEHAPFRRE